MLIENIDRMVVLAHYSEDLEWLSYLDLPYVLYTKSLANHPNFIIQNKGHEALCYFKYIVDAYPHFPRWIAFMHAHLTSQHQTLDALYLLKNLKWGKYEYININRDDWYTTLNATTSYQTEYSWIADFWPLFAHRFLGPIPPEIKHFTSAQFVVHRNRILAHPKEFYQLCYEWLLTTQLDNYISARVFEYTWHIIMGQPAIEPKRTHQDFLNLDPEPGIAECAKLVAANRAAQQARA